MSRKKLFCAVIGVLFAVTAVAAVCKRSRA